jgi:hypothetical protein
MLNKIYKWWTRKWSNWEHYQVIHINYSNMDGSYYKKTFQIMKRTSNDGLTEYKRILII